MKTKSVIVLSLILVSTFAMPTMVAGYGTGVRSSDFHLEDTELNQEGIGQIMGSLFDGFGSVFGGYGASGQILGEIFQMLFTDVYENLEKKEIMPGVWVFNATTSREGGESNKYISRKSTHFLPENYYEYIDVNSSENKVYCNVSTSGKMDLDFDRGGGITFIIWDNDRSFVKRLIRVVDFIKKMRDSGGEMTQEQMLSGINMMVDFFFNINNIFTEDELFVLNPITWERMTITPVDGGITINKTWYKRGENGGGTPLDPNQVSYLQGNATENSDPFMQYLANDTELTLTEKQTWSEFTFDLLQLWVKEFNINIDLSVLGKMVSNFRGDTGGGSPDGEMPTMGELFSDLRIQLNLFTHHLGGNFLYNDTNNDNGLTVEYENVTDSEGNPLRTENNRTIQVPKSTEITNRLYLQNATEFNYLSPKLGENRESVEWGINVTNVNVSTLPVGVGLESYVQKDTYNMDNIYLGFNFTSNIRPDGMVEAPVKLDQHFGEWTEGSGDLDDIDGLDLAVVYISTATYFRLQAEREEKDNYLKSKKRDFKNGDSEISIGDYVYDGDKNYTFVDIAGPGYEMGGTTYPANTSIIPLGLWSAEMDRRKTFNTSATTAGSSTQAYVSDISAQLDFEVMAYAVCYPQFDGSGDKIVHDPTFNVVMIFPVESFGTVILLTALLAPFGIATVVITLLKRRRII